MNHACMWLKRQHLMHAFSHTGPLHACIQSHYFVRSPSRRFLLHLRHLPLWASRARKQRDILQTHPQLHTFMHAWINQFGPCLVSQCSWRFHRCSLRLPNTHACTNENITCMHDISWIILGNQQVAQSVPHHHRRLLHQQHRHPPRST